MVNVKLGDKTYEGVTAVKTDTTDGGTADFAPYEETFAAGKAEGIEEGYANGKTDGIAEGYESGKTDGIAEGVQSEYDRFWDAFQMNGVQRVYRSAFGYNWDDKIFRPKYDIVIEDGYYAFSRFAQSRYYAPSLKQLLSDAGVSLSFWNSSSISSLFEHSYFSEIGELDFTSVKNITAEYLFSSCKRLVTIDKIILPVGQKTFKGWFQGCSVLENLTIEGEIGADIDISASPLTAASITSVITHLSDTTTGKTASFALNAVNAAFGSSVGAADGAESQEWLDLVATKSNWTISLV